MIEAKNVALTYPDGTEALREISLDIKPGELVYITGPSGSGKTSLLKLLIGIEQPTAGELKVLGHRMEKISPGELKKLRRAIGPVFQEFKLIQGRTALENVMMGMRFLGLPPKTIRTDAQEALIKVGLGHKLHTRVEKLSWGEAQRVAIARAVARKPSLILADEPTGNLDHDNAMNILQILKSFLDKNTTVVVTTHATHLIDQDPDASFIRVNSGNITIERAGGEDNEDSTV